MNTQSATEQENAPDKGKTIRFSLPDVDWDDPNPKCEPEPSSKLRRPAHAFSAVDGVRLALIVLDATLISVALGFVGLPYGYYTFLRFATCAISVFAAVKSFTQWERWLYFVVAAAYNPFIPLRMTRGAWEIVNLATVILVFASILTFYLEARKSERRS